MPTIQVCTGKTCTERYSNYLLARLRSDKAKYDQDDQIGIETCACRGKCAEAPVFLYEKELFTRANPIKASEVFLRKLAELKGKFEKTNQP